MPVRASALGWIRLVSRVSGTRWIAGVVARPGAMVRAVLGAGAAGLIVAGPLALEARAQGTADRSAPRLGAAARRQIDAVFRAYDKPAVPGCGLGVFRGGAVAYARGYGWADLERRVPITPATLFDIGSTSKQFTAASIALLVQEGKVSFSDDVRTYIPELPVYGTPITLDNLLHHTSGLRDYAGLLALAGHSVEEVTTDSQALALIVRQRHLDFPTGTRYEYTNTGFFLLSVIVQRVSGQPLADFARQHIFLPLGMTHTMIRNHFAMLIPGRALGYAPADSGTFRNSMSNWEQTGDGSVQLSVADARAWDENFYQPRVGGRALIDALETRGVLASGDTIAYARGLFIDRYRGLRRVEHGGDWIGYHAAFDRFPDQHTSVIVLCNSDGIEPSPLADRVADIVLAGAFGEPATASGRPPTAARATPVVARPTAPDRTRFLGSYFVAQTNEVVRVSDKDGGLTLAVAGLSLPLHPTGPASFVANEFPVTVTFETGGGDSTTGAPADSARTHSGSVRALRLQLESEPAEEAVRFTPATPDAETVLPDTGTYYSPELDVTWPVVAKDGHLVLESPKASLVDITGPLAPAMPDAFTAGSGFIHFTRDASNRVTGFLLSASRMRDIRFDRVASPLK